MATDVQRIIDSGAQISLHMNIAKCEIIHSPDTEIKSEILNSFSHICSQNATLLGAPLFEGVNLESALRACCDNLGLAINRLKVLSSHGALILLRASLSVHPKFNIYYVAHLVRATVWSMTSIIFSALD
jgi:hypothetical protein